MHSFGVQELWGSFGLRVQELGVQVMGITYRLKGFGCEGSGDRGFSPIEMETADLARAETRVEGLELGLMVEG